MRCGSGAVVGLVVRWRRGMVGGGGCGMSGVWGGSGGQRGWCGGVLPCPPHRKHTLLLGAGLFSLRADSFSGTPSGAASDADTPYTSRPHTPLGGAGSGGPLPERSQHSLSRLRTTSDALGGAASPVTLFAGGDAGEATTPKLVTLPGMVAARERAGLAQSSTASGASSASASSAASGAGALGPAPSGASSGQAWNEALHSERSEALAGAASIATTAGTGAERAWSGLRPDSSCGSGTWGEGPDALLRYR